MAPLLRQRVASDRGFERMYRRHATDVYRYALAVLQNEADAEDVTQTTFLNAFRAIERGERPETPHNWLIAIAHNVCRQRFRHLSRRPNEVGWEDDIADRSVEQEPASSGEDIRRALAHLAFNQRAALVMRELEGRSYAEIAEVLGLSVSAVETLIFRARRALREQLEGSLSCNEAELAISKQLDGRLGRSEKSVLRAHLRECPDCATLARRQRAQRSALRGIGLVPLPASLASILGGGGAAAGTAVALKAAAVVVVAAGVGGAAYEGATHARTPRHHAKPVAAHVTSPTHATAHRAPVVVSAAAPVRAAAHLAARVTARVDHPPGSHHVRHASVGGKSHPANSKPAGEGSAKQERSHNRSRHGHKKPHRTGSHRSTESADGGNSEKHRGKQGHDSKGGAHGRPDGATASPSSGDSPPSGDGHGNGDGHDNGGGGQGDKHGDGNGNGNSSGDGHGKGHDAHDVVQGLLEHGKPHG